MIFRLALLFILLPSIELALLIEVGQALGTVPTILLVVGTGVAGTALARTQGLHLVRRIRREVAAGRVPEDGLLDGLLILAGGLLLLAPGLLTDATGLILLTPLGRRSLRRWLRRRAQGWIEEGTLWIFRR